MKARVDPDRQIEEARASLVAHLGELGRRFRAMRTRADLRWKIASHPLASIGAAFALGALLGMRGGRRHEDGEPRLGRAAFAALAAVAGRLAKELAARGAAEAARGWWERRQQSSEIRTSYEPEVERFLER
jgi:hypothetical protein